MSSPRRDEAPSEAEHRGTRPWWLVSSGSSGYARFGAWLWLLMAGLAIVQAVTTHDPVVRWLAAGQIVLGLGLSASFFGSVAHHERSERHHSASGAGDGAPPS